MKVALPWQRRNRASLLAKCQYGKSIWGNEYGLGALPAIHKKELHISAHVISP
jgi:hypothetical protein